MTLLVRWGLQESGEVPENVDAAWSMAYYMLVPGVCTMLGVLVMAGPAVASELEQRSWVYLASRPHGILWLLLGKYLAAVSFGWSAALVGLTCSVVFCTAMGPFWLWLSMGILSLFSASCYAAAFLLLGVVVLRRAMVLCMVWVLFVEVILGALPAMVNRLTMQYRLRSILVQWLPIPEDVREEPWMSQAVGLEPVWQHMVWLVGFVVLYLSGALWLANRREFTAASEGDA
jgi:ABC-type transport system involved in multi-copper enzyme maturation permease subunit